MFREYKDVLAPIPSRLHSKVKDLRLNRTIIARRIKTRYPSIFHPIDPSTIIFIHPWMKPHRRKKKASKLKYIDLWEISERFRRSISIPDKAVGNFSPKRSENWITFDSPSIHSGATTLRMKTWKRGEKKARFSFPSPLFRFGCLPPPFLSPPALPSRSSAVGCAVYEQVSRTASGGTSTAKWFHRERVARELSRNVAGRQRGVACRGAAKNVFSFVCVQHCV